MSKGSTVIQKIWLLIFCPIGKMIMLRFFVVVVFLMSPQFGGIDIFTILYLIVQEHDMFFHFLKIYFMSFFNFYPGEGDSYPLQYSDLENPTDCIVSFLHRPYTSFGLFVWFACFDSIVNGAVFLTLNCLLPSSVTNNQAASAGDVFSIPGSGWLPRERNRNPLQYHCLGNPMDRGACRATVLGITKELDMMELLNSNNKVYRKSVDYCIIPVYPRWLSGKESAYQCRR